MSRSPRAEALRHVQSGTPIEPPELPADLKPNSPEALAYVDSYKEEHFVALARVTDLMLTRALQTRRPDNSLHPATKFHKDRWQVLADSWRRDLHAARDDIRSTEAYQTADRFAVVTGTLNTRRHISLHTKLSAGSGTAIITSLTMLRNLPRLIEAHLAPGETHDPVEVVRHPGSLGLMRRLAKQSVNQALAAQTALEGRSQATSWSSLDHTLRPEHFVLRRYPDGSASINYADFDGLQVPANYAIHAPFSPVKQPTLVKDIPSEQSKTIGCPITLLRGRLGELWSWGVDMVEANGLWDEVEPPAAQAVTPAVLSPTN